MPRSKKPRPEAGPPSPDVAVRLQKVLSRSGHGSRREIENWIRGGRVSVNGIAAELGQRVTPADQIEVDGKRLRLSTSAKVDILLLNKKTGTVATRHDPEDRTTVYEELPDLRAGRWVSVGRLDIQTSGLLLFTNDGELANKLMHPSTGLDREYAVRVRGKLSNADLESLQQGVDVDGEHLRFSDVRYYNGSGNNYWYHVVLMEGKNREVRRLFEAVGLTVSRLKRVRYGPVILPSWLRTGQWTLLQEEDVRSLYRTLGMRYEAPKRGPNARHKPHRAASIAKTSCLLPYPKIET